MPPLILLIAPESASPPILDTLQRDLPAEVEATPHRRSALASLRRRDFDLILLDESLAAADPASTDLLYQSAGAALLLELNFALCSPARILRQSRAAFLRRSRDQAQARIAAAASLSSDLNTALASLLLESELALREAGPAQAPRLSHLVQLVNGLRDRLRSEAPSPRVREHRTSSAIHPSS